MTMSTTNGNYSYVYRSYDRNDHHGITYEEQGATGRQGRETDNGLETSHLEPGYVFFTYLLTFTNNDFD